MSKPPDVAANQPHKQTLQVLKVFLCWYSLERLRLSLSIHVHSMFHFTAEEGGGVGDMFLLLHDVMADVVWRNGFL